MKPLKCFLFASFLLTCPFGYAGSATWNPVLGGNHWNDALNWAPNTVPNGPADTATFGAADITALSAGSVIEIDSMIFGPGASAYSIYVAYDGVTGPTSFYFLGAGVVNNSGVVQSMTARPESSIYFYNYATAGALTSFVVDGGETSVSLGADLQFFGNSNAGSATIVNEDANYGSAGVTGFFDSSSAANSTVTCNGGASTGYIFGGQVTFNASSTAANATLTAEGAQARNANGGTIEFSGSSTAADATLIANGGTNGGNGGQIVFRDTSDGGRARVELYGNGTFDGTQDVASDVTIGSLEGDGQILMGSSNLTIGTNNLSTIFSGLLAITSVLTKTGTGTLVLTNGSNYDSGTILDGGFLLINNTSGSGTGSGAVRVKTGTLGGGGIISGPVTIGTGGGSGAGLGPGKNSVTPGTLTIQQRLLLKRDATYKVTLNSDRVIADKVSANGVRIRAAQISLLELGASVLAPGTTLTVINNTAGTPIIGAFSNLPDGGTITVGNNTYRADYEGGDGNDLTLTVL